jgi:hypothetical protein
MTWRFQTFFDSQVLKKKSQESWAILENVESLDTTKISEKILFTTPCELVDPLTKIEGRFIIGQKNIYFIISKPALYPKKRFLKIFF